MHEVTINARNFAAEVLQATGPRLLLIEGPDCSACRRLEPVLAAVLSELSVDLHVARIDVANCPTLPRRLGVTVLPTLILFVDGQERWRGRGAVGDADELLDSLVSVLGGHGTGQRAYPSSSHGV